jgi:hypothetical protein
MVRFRKELMYADPQDTSATPKMLCKLVVMARCSPEDKQVIGPFVHVISHVRTRLLLLSSGHLANTLRKAAFLKGRISCATPTTTAAAVLHLHFSSGLSVFHTNSDSL